MHLGQWRACCSEGQSISSQSLSVRPQWKHETRSLFPVTEGSFYISLVFWGILFTCNKHTLTLKVLTVMEEPSVAQSLSRLFSGRGDGITECIRASPVAKSTYRGPSLWIEFSCLITCLNIPGLVAVKGHWKLLRGLQNAHTQQGKKYKQVYLLHPDLHNP